jgi:hypothetical protein
MSAVLLALFITIVVALFERQNNPLPDQPCWQCERTIHWIGTGWIHTETGLTWYPMTFAEYNALWKSGIPMSQLETPHPAARMMQ